MSVAAAAVYLAAKLMNMGDDPTERSVAEALGIAEVTLRHNIRKLGYQFDRNTHVWVRVAEDGASIKGAYSRDSGIDRQGRREGIWRLRSIRRRRWTISPPAPRFPS